MSLAAVRPLTFAFASRDISVLGEGISVKFATNSHMSVHY